MDFVSKFKRLRALMEKRGVPMPSLVAWNALTENYTAEMEHYDRCSHAVLRCGQYKLTYEVYYDGTIRNIRLWEGDKQVFYSEEE